MRSVPRVLGHSDLSGGRFHRVGGESSLLQPADCLGERREGGQRRGHQFREREPSTGLRYPILRSVGSMHGSPGGRPRVLASGRHHGGGEMRVKRPANTDVKVKVDPLTVQKSNNERATILHQFPFFCTGDSRIVLVPNGGGA